eukprot:TRINITY_DN8473_c0_g1_i1.p2 TRINITY_DN8473_c0_g1~~TRINITY_DN8473_c0_g1_i1.p2  ORF type:complete len:161 (-),score=15.20 TRINITY_DN8473_c0_g1_i1:291-719(-)
MAFKGGRDGFNHLTVFDSGSQDSGSQDGYQPLPQVSSTVVGIRTDDELARFMFQNKDKTQVVQWGASWCQHCQEIFPVFQLLTQKFQKCKYGLAQIDYMEQASRSVKYTPTFTIFKGGKRVDEFYGVDSQKLRDHIWLHTDV